MLEISHFIRCQRYTLYSYKGVDTEISDSKQPNTQFMNRVSERINQVLLEYVNQNYPDQDGRFLQLIMKLPELRAVRYIDTLIQ